MVWPVGGRFKDGACFCYCAYVLSISRWSEKAGFLTVVPAKTKISLRGFITTREKQILARVIGIRKENYGQPCIFQCGKKSIHCFVFWRFLELLLLNYLKKNVRLPPIFFLDFNSAC